MIAHGANPGLVNHFVKDALLFIAEKNGMSQAAPKSRQDWIHLAHDLGIKVIHIAERDTQYSSRPKTRGEFVNTWSVDGFIAESCQPSELGWGTHEVDLPADGLQHPIAAGQGDLQEGGGCPAICLKQPGIRTHVRSWTPSEGPMNAWIITHNEAISIADYFGGIVGGKPYRPTVCYAYHPCDAAVLSLHELEGRGLHPQPRRTVLSTGDVVGGTDELGVLLMGNQLGSLWYGSRLSIEQARAAAPHNTATTLQVVAAIAAGMQWAMAHPHMGIVEADELPHAEIVGLCRPYLGDIVAAWTDWTPLQGRSDLFPEDMDLTDPWQFKNFRIA